MLLHSLQWIRHKFNEVITDPSCEFMLTVCSQSHGPSTVNSRQSFQPGLPANKPVTGRLGAATLGHRRQTITLLGFLLVSPSVCPYSPSPPCLGLPTAPPPSPPPPPRGFLTPCDAFPPPRSCHIRDAGSPDGMRGGWRARGWDGSCLGDRRTLGWGWGTQDGRGAPPAPLPCWDAEPKGDMQGGGGGGSLHWWG